MLRQACRSDYAESTGSSREVHIAGEQRRLGLAEKWIVGGDPRRVKG
jgi:hypothetical protein